MVRICGSYNINIKVYCFFSALMAGTSAFCISWARSFPTMAIVLGLYGAGLGSWFVLIPTITAKNHGITKLGASYGFVRFCMGGVNFVSPQISGAWRFITLAFWYFIVSEICL